MWYTLGMPPSQKQRPVSQPVYRRPRSHAYSCRCPKCDKPADWGVITPLIAIIGAGFLVSCWPALAWHGYTDTGGWRWDIHSTVACAVWWGALLFIAVLVAVANRKPRRTVPPPQPDRRREGPGYQKTAPPAGAAPLPICQHSTITPVNNIVTGKLEAWLCLNPDCDAQLDPGFRAAELQPDTSWPQVRLVTGCVCAACLAGFPCQKGNIT